VEFLALLLLGLACLFCRWAVAQDKKNPAPAAAPQKRTTRWNKNRV
jgi:hypothetical protein